MHELVYEGELIRRRDEKLNLTDMWRAAGADPNKRPAEWARKEGAPFIDFIAEGSNVAVGHIIEAERGRDGGTWAHWQVGLAYAKYLSPAFHAWCNEVASGRLPGRGCLQPLSSRNISVPWWENPTMSFFK